MFNYFYHRNIQLLYKSIMTNKFPAAIPPPQTTVTYISKEHVNDSIELSKQSPRKRIILPFHKSNEDKLHRMFNALQPGTYIRPHCHMTDNKCESVIVLQGGICFITFKEDGEILSYQNIYANSDIFGVDLEPDTIHSFVVLEPDTLIFEVKPGPYVMANDKDFMPWAPEEGTEEANLFVDKLLGLTENK